MALANYFSKDALAIMQVLRSNSVSQLEATLNAHVIEIALGEVAASPEMTATLDLLVRLLCRLYPKIRLTDLSGQQSTLVEALIGQARKINQHIEVVDEPPSISLVVGQQPVERNTPVFYLGSDGWVAKLSSQAPVGSGNSSYPFAAGAASCLGAANVFRFVFQDYLDGAEMDKELQFSLVDLTLSGQNAAIEINDLGKVTLVGIGAIGNGAIWALSQLPDTRGTIHLVDEQPLGLSNLQRYVTTEEEDIGKPKTEIAAALLKHTRFDIYPYPHSWATYMDMTQNWSQTIVLTALDSAKDRRAVQSALPKHILNAFTEEGLLGISRHFNFLEQACLSCVYMPSGVKKSHSQVVAENLGIPNLEPQVRNYLYYNQQADDQLLGWIAAANAVPVENLHAYRGLPMSEFYSNFVCGGILLKLRGGLPTTQKLEAPLAFQSAMAGILLVAELVLWKAGVRNESFPVMTHIYPLLPLSVGSNPYNHQLAKDGSGRCLCADDVFQNAYQQKWVNKGVGFS